MCKEKTRFCYRIYFKTKTTFYHILRDIDSSTYQQLQREQLPYFTSPLTNIIKKKVEISKLCKACFNPRPPGSLVFLFHSHYRSEPAGKGMAGGQLAPTIVFTSPNVVLLGVSFQPPCHIVKGTLDAIWERVKHD